MKRWFSIFGSLRMPDVEGGEGSAGPEAAAEAGPEAGAAEEVVVGAEQPGAEAGAAA